MKVKHNKKRNTAFIFESLIREVTRAVVQKNHRQKRAITALLREHFHSGSPLRKELECYRALLECSGFDAYTAEKTIHRAKEAHRQLDKTAIFQEQSAIIRKINQSVGASFFSNFVPNYRSVASIAQIFSDKTPLKQKVILERQILQTLSSEKEEASAPLVPVDGLVVKQFATNYNDRYAHLLPEQRHLLEKYILAFGDNDVDFRLALGSELKRIHEAVEASLSLADVSSDDQMVQNTQRVLAQVREFNVSTVGPRELKKVLKLQKLVSEYKDDAPQD